MSLSLLPTELKLKIIEHLDPASTFHVALSSKAHLNLCGNQLQEHARLFARYSVIQPSNEGFLIWELTKEILQDPQRGWYARELDLVSDRPAEYPDLPDEDRLVFKAAAKKVLSLYPYESNFFATERSDPRDLDNEINDHIDRGYEAPILVLLVHHLPQLRTFRMTDNLISGTFQDFMRRVAAGYQSPSMAPNMPLQHLSLAAIAHHDTESSCSVDWAVYFICIPSLKTFAAFMMGSEHIGEYEMNEEAHLRITTKAAVSNVEELLFQGCQFDPESFDTFLPMIKNLKMFSYDAGGHIVAHQDMEPRKVLKALVTHSGHSLEELDLAEASIGFEDGEEDIRSVSLRDFQRLKALRCETRWLLRRPEDLWKDIELDDDAELPEDHHFVDNPVGERSVYSRDPRDNLPESLEYLYLDGNYQKDEWKNLIKMFKIMNANTPKLTIENVCLDRNSEAKYGRAVEPHVRFANPLLDNIWKRHNYFI
ncbi:hypothetical protein E8E12_011421 [Didymella heteroderae]|uniref:F-box domain-containing protein n=1 Tax=Didymella heteroderae TaxID=1769908 RepID=A0A9P4X2A0_9PLEO|nr:hypothetical protein E8E12_011421 [Didymella heteroderae]